MNQTDRHHILAVHGLNKNFGALAAIDDLNVEIPKNGIFGIIGPNGSGKTTLFNIISGRYPADSGSIFFRDQELIGRSSEDVASLGIARTFQNIRVFARLSVIENVLGAQTCAPDMSLLQAIIPHLARERRRRAVALEILDRVGLSDHQNLLADQLSLGEQRRLELARAIARKPDIMMLDEPASGMPPQETEVMAHLIESIAKDGPTILLIEHKVGMVMALCHQIAVLNFGRKIAEGTPEEIQNNSTVIEAYLGAETANA